MVKCGFVADPEILRLVEADPAAALDPASDVLRELVERAVRVKADVVAGDLQRDRRRPRPAAPRPRGAQLRPHDGARDRAGDATTGVRHGEAVALGMVFVAELARLAGRLDDDDGRPARGRARLVGLPTRWRGAPFDELLAHHARSTRSRAATCCGSWCSTGWRDPAILDRPDEELLRAAYDVMAGGLR